MNEVVRAIFARAGVKEYTTEPVKKEDLDLILRAGVAAPNAYNKQAWRFYAVTRADLLREIDQATYEALVERGITKAGSGYHPLHDAPVLIVVSSSRENPFAKQDCSCANQNMALAAWSLGLATRFLDVPNYAFNSEGGAGLKKACKVPEGYDTVCFLCLGHPADPGYSPTPKKTDVIDWVQ